MASKRRRAEQDAYLCEAMIRYVNGRGDPRRYRQGVTVESVSLDMGIAGLSDCVLRRMGMRPAQLLRECRKAGGCQPIFDALARTSGRGRW